MIKDIADIGSGFYEFLERKYYQKMNDDMFIRQLYIEMFYNLEIFNLLKLDKEELSLPTLCSIVSAMKLDTAKAIFYDLKHSVYKKLSNEYDFEINNKKVIDNALNKLKFLIIRKDLYSDKEIIDNPLINENLRLKTRAENLKEAVIFILKVTETTKAVKSMKLEKVKPE